MDEKVRHAVVHTLYRMLGWFVYDSHKK
jgi:hypothetical protein